jgi:flavin reductase (DIM6/NTAB) family NADH-FMN oxidoreductase RutF
LPGVIHDENPFDVPEADRDPVRRFRGRMPAPVTVVTAGAGARATGLTVSSLMVADGEPGRILFLCGRNADLGDVVASSGGFVVHLVAAGGEALSDRFAGTRPSPGGLFAGLAVSDGPRGPVMTSIVTRAECVHTASSDAGWYLVVEGAIETVALGDPVAPLLRWRGRYLGVDGG